MFKFDDLVVELNDDIGNITIENENESQLTRTFDNPFRWKCDFCDFIAKSERGLKTHITRKHEICDWCDFVKWIHTKWKSIHYNMLRKF